MSLKSSFHLAILVSGVLISLAAVMALPNFYHGDLTVFWGWMRYWIQNWHAIYRNCAGCNYPILGMISSAGLLSLFRNAGYQKAVFVFRVILGITDGLNVVLIFLLFKELTIEKASFWAGIIGLLLSSWVGGALWGQIDGIALLFILIALFWIIRNNSKETLAKKNFSFYILSISYILGSILLIKQLTIFSLVSIGFLLITNIFFFTRDIRRTAPYVLFMLVAILISITIWDPFLYLKAPYFSHLIYIFETGSNHANIISGNGFNIWVFLGRNMWSSSHISFLSLGSKNNSFSQFFTPFVAGLFLFLVFNLITFFSFYLFLKNRYMAGERYLNREILLCFIFHLALVNLSFNVFLTGTHERYLYFFYPFILLACLGLGKYNKYFLKVIPFLIFGATLYGLFVLWFLSGVSIPLGYTPFWILSLFHLGLLLYFFQLALKYQNFKQNLMFIAKSERVKIVDG